jgi:hypothetical protein
VYQERTEFLVPGNQEIGLPEKKRPGNKTQEIPGNHPVSAALRVFLDLWCSSETKERTKIACF